VKSFRCFFLSRENVQAYAQSATVKIYVCSAYACTVHTYAQHTQALCMRMLIIFRICKYRAYACTVLANTEHMHAPCMRMLSYFRNCTNSLGWYAWKHIDFSFFLEDTDHTCAPVHWENTCMVYSYTHYTHARCTRMLSERMKNHLFLRSFEKTLSIPVHHAPVNWVYACFVHAHAQYTHARCMRMLNVHILFQDLNNKLKKNNMTKCYWSLNLPSR